MTAIFLGLGSNVQPAHHLAVGLDALRALLGALRCSAVYEGAAVGFDGARFWNLVVQAETDLAVGELARTLRDIEYAHGRARNATRYSDRTLDIDLLLYGACAGEVDGVVLPRDDVLAQAFVLRPLAELAPDARHPGTGRTFADHWQSFDQTALALTEVSL